MAARSGSRGPALRPHFANPAAPFKPMLEFTSKRAQVLPLCNRLIDLVIGSWLFFFAIVALASGNNVKLMSSPVSHSGGFFFLPGLPSVTATITESSIKSLRKAALPPLLKLISNLFYAWAGKVDGALLDNAPWMAAVAIVQTCVLSPFALAASYGIICGHSWVKTPSLVWAGCVIYSVVLCVLNSRCVGEDRNHRITVCRKTRNYVVRRVSDCAAGGDFPSGGFEPFRVRGCRLGASSRLRSGSDGGQDAQTDTSSSHAIDNGFMFLGVYQLFVILPLIMAARLYRSRFTRGLDSLFAFTLHATAGASWAVFWSYVLKFLVLYQPSLVHADILAMARTTLLQLP